MNIILVVFTTDASKYITLKKKEEIFTNSFLATSDLEGQYANLQAYERAVLILDCLTFKPPLENKEEYLSKNYNANYVTLKLLKLMRYKQVMVCLDQVVFDSKQFGNYHSEINYNLKKIEESIISIFNDEERDFDFRRNALDLPNPEVKVVQNLTKKAIKQFFHQKYTIENLQNPKVECVVLNLIGKKHIVRVLQGQLYEGQLLYSVNKKGYIQSVSLNQQGEIQVEFEEDLILKGILFSHSHNPEIIKKVCAEVQLCELPIYAAKDAFRKMGPITMLQYNQSFRIPNTRVNPIESHGQLDQNGEYKRLDQQINFNLIRIEFQIDSEQFLNLQQQPTLFFKNSSNEIVFYGKLSSVVEKNVPNKEMLPYFILPKFTQQIQNLMINDIDLRYCCRICKKQPVSRVIQDCGHMRYCGECIEFCIEAKECYYCSQKLTKVHPIRVQYVDTELYKKIRIKKEAMQTQENTQILLPNNLPPYYQIVKQILKEGNVNFHTFYCQHCDLKISEKFYVCQSDHMILVCRDCKPKECITCQKQVVCEQQIKYQFADDECQI